MLGGYFDSVIVKIAFCTTEWIVFVEVLREVQKNYQSFLTSVTLLEEALIRLVRKWKRLDMCHLTCVT
jgi:hypothetical protein